MAEKLSSILATSRPELIPAAVGQWLGQRYQPRELVIVQEAGTTLYAPPAYVPPGTILVLAAALGATLGAKLNQGVLASTGTLLHKWDDDDLYAPGFLSRGAAALADADFACWAEFLVRLPGGETRIVHGWPLGGAFFFWRTLAQAYPFAGSSANVDGQFLLAIEGHARQARVTDSPTLYTYIRTGRNTWKTRNGKPVEAFLRGISSPWPSPVRQGGRQ